MGEGVQHVCHLSKIGVTLDFIVANIWSILLPDFTVLHKAELHRWKYGSDQPEERQISQDVKENKKFYLRKCLGGC